MFDGHSAVPGTPALVLEDFGLTVHLWDGTFTRDLGDGRAGWLSATVGYVQACANAQAGN